MEDTSSAAARLLQVFAHARTARLDLRRLSESDLAAVFRVQGDPETNRYNPHGPLPDLDAAAAWLSGCMRAWDGDGVSYWAVSRADKADVIGFAGVRRLAWERDQRGDILNLFYRFTPSVWGQGYATEAAREAVRLGCAHLPSLPIVARIRSDNLPSIKTAERAGLEWRPDLDAGDYRYYTLNWPQGGEDHQA